MNLKERLEHLASISSKDRMMGRTTLIAKVAKDLNGMVLAHSHQDALRIKRTHGVEARSIDLNLHGFSGPFFFDHFAIEKLLFGAADKIETLEKEIKTLNDKIDKVKQIVNF